jgi:tRNA-binding EMAP/Myf-like protein
VPITAASLTDTQGIIALAAAAVALVALLGCAVLAVRLGRLRTAQRTVLGEYGERDLVAHTAALQEAFGALREYVGDAAERLDERVAAVELALRGTITHRALVRYDAYNELSGRQSMSIALLDDTRSGIVLSCIHHRDQARLYAKQVHDGHSELELSPEEAEAMQLALSGPPVDDVPELSP